MRLPTARELRSIRDYCHLPAFDQAVFGGLDHGDRFFTDTAAVGSSTAVMQVDVDSTYVSYRDKDAPLRALCVR